MVPKALSILSAFLSLGGVQLVAGQGNANSEEIRPKYLLPREFKRQIGPFTNTTIPTGSNSNPISALDSVIESIIGLAPLSSSVAATPPTTIVVIPVYISVGSDGVTHTVTGTAPLTTAYSVPTSSATTTSTSPASASPSVTAAATSLDSQASAGTSSAHSTGSSASADLLSSLLSNVLGSTPTSGTGSSTSPSSKSANPFGSVLSSVGGILSETATPTPKGNGTRSATSSAFTSSVPTLAASNSSVPATSTSSYSGGLLGVVSSVLSELLPTPSVTTNSTSALLSLPTIPSTLSLNITAVPTASASSTSANVTSTASGTLISSSGSASPTNVSIITTVNVTASATPTSSVHPSGNLTSVISTSRKLNQTAILTSTAKLSSPISSLTASHTTHSTHTVQPSTSDNNFVPSSILVQPTITAAPTGPSSRKTKSTTTVQLPAMIAPAGGSPTAVPTGSTLIQLGFNSELRYNFVASNPLSSSQIFLYVPDGIEYALQISSSDVTMHAIQPYDNSASTGYVATVALAYVPTDLVNDLAQMLHNPNSRLYDQQNPSVRTLMSLLNPTIPLVVGDSRALPAGSTFESTGASSGSGGSSGAGGNGNGGNTGSDAGASSSAPARASSVGIGVGVVAGAAAYGAGMFWIARRYRKKRQLHQRSSSTISQMAQPYSDSSVFVNAGRGSRNSHRTGVSGRTQMISAPVMAENSLGWN